MNIEIVVPSPGESITQVQVAKWLVHDGESVEKDQEVVEIDSDKASFPVTSPENGIIRIKSQEGETLSVGAVMAIVEINEGALPSKPKSPQPLKAAPVVEAVPEKPTPALVPPPPAPPALNATPLVKNIVEKENLPAGEIGSFFGGKKITRRDLAGWKTKKEQSSVSSAPADIRSEERRKMTTLRLKLSERLVGVKNQTAMLTTFNEVNMQAALSIKEKFSAPFKEKYGVGIGLMSFFTKAVTIALRDFPQVNSMIDGDEIVTPRYADIGIAVSAPKGLVVPVLRNAEMLSISEIELKIKELAVKARDNKITIDDMKGGTFTITNGGVFGSLLSTPILNPPQSAILGMHKIQERPVAINGQVVIAPMMYVALSYDHRIIDGRESVGFLVKVKELVEDPVRLLTEGEDPVRMLLDL
jgi:2-oxoglutarate dehydrogenase E2 component (dihydrolipoamide succinyltransferase)